MESNSLIVRIQVSSIIAFLNELFLNRGSKDISQILYNHNLDAATAVSETLSNFSLKKSFNVTSSQSNILLNGHLFACSISPGSIRILYFFLIEYKSLVDNILLESNIISTAVACAFINNNITA